LAPAKWLDHIWVYYADEIDTKRKRWSLIKSLRRENFDLWIELPNDPATLFMLIRNMLMAKLAGARWACGWKLNTIKWAVQAQTELLSFPNEVNRLLGMLAQIGFEAEAVFPLEFDRSIEGEVQSVLRGIAASASALVGVAPGAKRLTNKWPIERYQDVTHHLVARGFHVVLIGGEQDRAICEEIVSAISPGVTNLAGRLSLLGSCQVLKACEFVVCNDSGVQHLAAAMGRPCISLFSSRDFRGKWWPHGSNNAVIVKAVDCHTCLLESCPFDNYCMKLIQTDEVKALIDSRVYAVVDSAS
jgi:heptosyltransferase-2